METDINLRNFIRETINEYNSQERIRYWADYYHDLANIAHHRLTEIAIISENNIFDNNEKLKEINRSYTKYINEIQDLD